MDSKRCCRCQVDLPLTEFARHPRDKLQPMCRPCNRVYQREHYRRNRNDYLVKASAWIARRRSENLVRILAYLAANPCVDCGEADPLVLQFDHVRGVKVKEVSSLYYSGASWKRILIEIGKCEVRCAVCHFRRHARDSGWRRLALAEDIERARAAVRPCPVSVPDQGDATFSDDDLKWCGYCGWDLPLDQFSIHRGGRQSRCKSCHRAYTRDHYRRNRERYLARTRVRNRDFQETNQALLVSYLANHPCVDCGELDPVVLQCDHVRGVKSANIAQLIRDCVSWERIAAEIAKCDVRCANCHQRRTSAARRTINAMRLGPVQRSLGL